MPGETAEQWRGEGTCERLPLDELMDLLPHYTVAAMVSSKRIETENALNAMNDSGVSTVPFLRNNIKQVDEILASHKHTFPANFIYG